MRKYTLEFVVFTCGMVVMIYELVGSRVLAPYLGSSLFVWTSIIGIILGSLSLGYYLGGKLADREAGYRGLSVIIFLAAVFVLLAVYIKDPILSSLALSAANIRESSVIASVILFGPTSVLLGMVSPYAVKLKLKNLQVSGSTVGTLYAISTIGSIFGTFLSGFYLIPHIGTNNLLIALSGLLIVTSLISYSQILKIQLLALILVIVTFGANGIVQANNAEIGYYNIDTEYNQIVIYEGTDPRTQRPFKEMRINNESSSAMFLDSDDLVYSYTKYYDLAEHFHPAFETSLLMGGAGYSYPKHYLQKYPDATMDVVEIDPMLTELARQHFKLVDDPRLRIYHEDARTFLNASEKKYDVIFGDAFKSNYSIPFQLTTREAVQKEYDMLNENGVLLANLISSIEGKKGEFLRAEVATYKSVFPQVFIIPVSRPDDAVEHQNIILIALKSDREVSWNSNEPDFDAMLKNRWEKTVEADMPILTDDYAPIDYYLNREL